MHEPSIVEALIDEIQRQLRAHPGARLRKVHVRVGQLRHVVPEIMSTCFDVMTKDTPLAGAELRLEHVPATALCAQCARTFPVEDNFFACPSCQATDATLQSGNELELTSLELTS
jgi:hydrogenase nickel incorporation protein HypA/HybF